MLKQIVCNSLLVVFLSSVFAVSSEKAPYEDFRAADFTRGERSELKEGSVGIYSHFRRTENIAQGGARADNPSDIHHSRWIPVLIADYRFLNELNLTMFLHAGVANTDYRDTNGARVKESVGYLGDIVFMATWHPWLRNVHENHTHTFFDLHNLGFVFGPKFDISKQDEIKGDIASAAFRRTASGSHDINVGLAYTGHLNKSSWLYYYNQQVFPLSNTNFGLRPGVQSIHVLGFSWLPNEVGQLFISAGYLYEQRGSGGDFPLIAENSGGDFWFITPGMTFDITHGLGVEFSVTFPIVQNVRGTHPVQSEDYFFGFYYSF